MQSVPLSEERICKVCIPSLRTTKLYHRQLCGPPRITVNCSLTTMEDAEPTNRAYEKELREAGTADLTLVHGRQIVQVVRNEDGTLGTDSEGAYIVMLTPSLMPNDSSAWEKAFQMFVLETQEVSSKTKAAPG